MKAARALSLVERSVLRDLRGGPDASEDPLRAALRALAREAVASGQVIHPPEAPFVSADERRLLGLLALGQRRVSRSWIDTALARALLHAVAMLSDRQIWLPVARGIVGEGDFADMGLVSARHVPTQIPIRTSGRELEGTLRGKVVATLRDRGSLFRHELVRLGISRQYLYRMVRDGTLVPAGAGRYRLSSPNGS